MKNKHYETPDMQVVGVQQQDVVTASPSDPILEDIYGSDGWID